MGESFEDFVRRVSEELASLRRDLDAFGILMDGLRDVHANRLDELEVLHPEYLKPGHIHAGVRGDCIQGEGFELLGRDERMMGATMDSFMTVERRGIANRRLRLFPSWGLKYGGVERRGERRKSDG